MKSRGEASRAEQSRGEERRREETRRDETRFRYYVGDIKVTFSTATYDSHYRIDLANFCPKSMHNFIPVISFISVSSALCKIIFDYSLFFFSSLNFLFKFRESTGDRKC
jgi:hypothetical protein